METENLDPDSYPDPKSDPELIPVRDPNLQIISDPVGSECTTLLSKIFLNSVLSEMLKKIIYNLSDNFLTGAR